MSEIKIEVDAENPTTNILSAGTTPNQVNDAIRRSGYPLQTRIAQVLAQNFYVQEEWSYEDRDTKSLRAMDILAQRFLYDPENRPLTRARPILSILVECKQSDLPFVFFRGAKTVPSNFPVFAGLHTDKISVRTTGTLSTWTCETTDALSLRDTAFVANAPICTSFSKCVRKGKDLELSGSEPFQSLILPLVKAIRHFKRQVAPPKTAHYHDCHIVLGLAVLDAPMIFAEFAAEEDRLTMVPWVRVMRHEAEEADHQFDRSKSFGIDVVHKDFLAEFIERHLLGFADIFSSRALKHHEELATGKGFAEDMMEFGVRALESRLKPS